jgi:hypothetical protein
MHENKVQTCLALSVKKLEKKLTLVKPVKYCDRDHDRDR